MGTVGGLLDTRWGFWVRTFGHHVKHWIDGGSTRLLNLALLCQYHHTWVHQRDLTATVTAFGVTWQT